jgi:hypothetical protein
VNALAVQTSTIPSSPHYPRRNSPPRSTALWEQQVSNPNQPYRSPTRKPTGGTSTGKYPMVVD